MGETHVVTLLGEVEAHERLTRFGSQSGLDEAGGAQDAQMTGDVVRN
jgi:hypothetical protein